MGLIGSAMGGGAALSATYQAALEGSVARHFRGNHAINCMCHSTENLYRWAEARGSGRRGRELHAMVLRVRRLCLGRPSGLLTPAGGNGGVGPGGARPRQVGCTASAGYSTGSRACALHSAAC